MSIPAPRGTEKPAILVVEDDEHIAFLLQYMLSREGFEPQSAEDGRAAQQLIDRMTPPRGVLMDVKLPFMDGFHLIEYIRAKDGWAQVPILMLTSQSEERDIVRALDAGANDYIVKPFQALELMARLRRFMR